MFLLANALREADMDAHGWVRPGVHLVRYGVAEVLQVGGWAHVYAAHVRF